MLVLTDLNGPGFQESLIWTQTTHNFLSCSLSHHSKRPLLSPHCLGYWIFLDSFLSPTFRLSINPVGSTLKHNQNLTSPHQLLCCHPGNRPPLSLTCLGCGPIQASTTYYLGPPRDLTQQSEQSKKAKSTTSLPLLKALHHTRLLLFPLTNLALATPISLLFLSRPCTLFLLPWRIFPYISI